MALNTLAEVNMQFHVAADDGADEPDAGFGVDDFDLLDRLLSSPEVLAAERDADELFSLLQTLRRARKDQGLSQLQVGKSMHTSQSAVSMLEGGAVDPQVATLMRYARALGLRIEMRAAVDRTLAKPWADDWLGTAAARRSGQARAKSPGLFRFVGTPDWHIAAAPTHA